MYVRRHATLTDYFLAIKVVGQCGVLSSFSLLCIHWLRCPKHEWGVLLGVSQLTNNSDIMKRRSDFVGKSNNVFCFFCKSNANIKCKLFLSYCMSLYGWLCALAPRE